ncbi:MAG: beta-ketoacyl synthase N-terminal-like domain-containing protein [Acidimicrobiia bacterium]
MSDDDIVISSLGMVTPVGLSSRETAASVRAGIARFAQTLWTDTRLEPLVLSEVPAAGLPPLTDSPDELLSLRERRLVQLARSALAECVAPLTSARIAARVAVALPEVTLQFLRGRNAFLAQLIATPDRLPLQPSDPPSQGRAGGLLALGEAIARLRAGKDRFVVAGGVDSYHDPAVLRQLDQEKRVKSSRNLDGFIPGEGAAFLLLSKRRTAAEVGLPPIAVLTAVASGVEEGHFYSTAPYRGEGLAATFRTFFSSNGLREPVREVYSSMNGERFWAKEWGVAYLRSRSAFSPAHGMHHPADSYGDVGAASGPLMVGLAALGVQGGYRQSPCLVYCSSDFGPRAVVAASAA